MRDLSRAATYTIRVNAANDIGTKFVERKIDIPPPKPTFMELPTFLKESRTNSTINITIPKLTDNYQT